MTSNLTHTQQFLGLRRFYPNLAILSKIQPNVQFSLIFISHAPNMSQKYFYIIIQYENVKKTILPFFPQFA